MHKFLRAIGFSEIEKNDLQDLIEDIVDAPSEMMITEDSEGNEFAEFLMDFAPDMGITVRGTYEEDDSFQMSYYYPHYFGSSKTTNELIDIEKHAEKESYAGVCDEVNFGVTLIFYLQNVVEYLSMKKSKMASANIRGAYLSCLSVEGKILFPVRELENTDAKGYNSHQERSQLIAKAREGNEEAIENLTLEDMDMYSIISKRIMREDILSIVKTYFMPYGIESDQYSVLGLILECDKVINKITGEGIYAMKLECNDLIFDVCINERDLIGEPAVGRRFKGNVWMQGSICL